MCGLWRSYFSFISTTLLLLLSCTHSPTAFITLRASPAFTCVLCVYGALWFHDSSTVIDRCWFTDNPWLRSHCGPHKERAWLSASHVLESKLRVALDTHLSLSLPPLTLCRSLSAAIFYTPLTPRCQCDFILLTGHRYSMITYWVKCHVLRGAQ